MAKRYTFSVPNSVQTEIEHMSRSNNITSKEVIIRALKLAFIAFEADSNENKELILREAFGTDRTETHLLLT